MRGLNLSITGQVTVTVTDAQGNVVSQGTKRNQVTNYAANAVAQWLCGVNNTGYNPTLPPQYMELGTGSGTPSATDTNLFTPVSATNQHVSSAQVPSGSPNVAQFTAQYFGTANNAGSYTEAGLFDANGNLFAHLMDAITITQGLSTTLAWTITVTV